MASNKISIGSAVARGKGSFAKVVVKNSGNIVTDINAMLAGAFFDSNTGTTYCNSAVALGAGSSASLVIGGDSKGDSKMAAVSIPSMPAIPAIPAIPTVPSIPAIPEIPTIPAMAESESERLFELFEESGFEFLAWGSKAEQERAQQAQMREQQALVREQQARAREQQREQQALIREQQARAQEQQREQQALVREQQARAREQQREQQALVREQQARAREQQREQEAQTRAQEAKAPRQANIYREELLAHQAAGGAGFGPAGSAKWIHSRFPPAAPATPAAPAPHHEVFDPLSDPVHALFFRNIQAEVDRNRAELAAANEAAALAKVMAPPPYNTHAAALVNGDEPGVHSNVQPPPPAPPSYDEVPYSARNAPPPPAGVDGAEYVPLKK
jgi:chemotaxis protein histidine kinase CheA